MSLNILCQSRAYVVYLKHEVKIFFIHYFINKISNLLEKLYKNICVFIKFATDRPFVVNVNGLIQTAF